MKRKTARTYEREKARKAITIQLREDDEHDLIAWLDDVPAGDRNAVIRDALRTYMNTGAGRQATARRATTADVSAVTDTISQWFGELWENVESKLGALPTTQGVGSSDALRGIAVALAGIDSRLTALAQGVPLAAAQDAEQPPQAVAQLTDAEQQRRNDRMKKSAKW